MFPLTSTWIQLPLNSLHSEERTADCASSVSQLLYSIICLCANSFLPLWKRLVILFSRFQMFSCSLDDLAKCHWYLQTSRSLKNIYRSSGSASQKHSNWATVWIAKTAEPQDEMPSNAHMLHLPEIWATARDVTSSSKRKKKQCVWTAFTFRRFMPVLWLI